MRNYLQIAFLVIGTLTILEFVFLRGMFTWLMAAAGTIGIGILNIISSIAHKEWMMAYFYALSTFALCMGYFTLA